jgi:hypothetical protein
MLEILALAPDDGWAFVNQDGRVFLVRPPYAHAQATQVTAAVVDRAVAAYGFQAEARSFDTWEKLVEYLSREIVNAAAGRPRMDDAGRRLLRHASRETVVRFLDRVAGELLPQREWSAAAATLEALLDHDLVIADQELRRRAIELLRACAASTAGEGSRGQLLRETLDLKRWCPRTARRYGEMGVRSFIKQVQDERELLRMPG